MRNKVRAAALAGIEIDSVVIAIQHITIPVTGQQLNCHEATEMLDIELSFEQCRSFGRVGFATGIDQCFQIAPIIDSFAESFSSAASIS